MPPMGSNTILSEDELEAALAEIDSQPEEAAKIPSLDDGNPADAPAATPKPPPKAKTAPRKPPPPTPAEPVVEAPVDDAPSVPAGPSWLAQLVNRWVAGARRLLPALCFWRQLLGRRGRAAETAAAETPSEPTATAAECSEPEFEDPSDLEDASAAPEPDAAGVETDATDDEQPVYDEFVDETKIDAPPAKPPWWQPLCEGLDVALGLLNRPFTRLSDQYRYALGVFAIATIVICITLWFLAPMLLHSGSAVHFVRQKHAELQLSSPND